MASSGEGPLVAWSDTRLGDGLTGTQDIAVARVDLDRDRPRTAVAAIVGGVAGLLLGAGLGITVAAAIVRRRRAGAAPA